MPRLRALTRSLLLSAGLLICSAFLGCGEAEGDDPGECADDSDNDEDGLFDCNDDDCFGADACADQVPGTEEYITGGQLTRAFAATGALISYEGQAFCTATLVAPDVVLTAAHCVQNQGAGSMAFMLGADFARPAAHSRVQENIAIAPGWSGNVQAGFDLAVLHLESPIWDVLPANVFLDPVNQLVGQELTLVGYGRQATDHVTGLRRLARVALQTITPQTLAYGFTGQGACHGDSGGPAFARVDGVWRQVGVTSWGDPSCVGVGHYQRLDVLAQWLQTNGVPLQRESLSCEADGCDGQCEEDSGCWALMCPSGDCSAPGGKCGQDGACDSDCGYSDPDCGGAQDLCALYGLYGNGVCNQGCYQPDPDCVPQACYPAYDPYYQLCYTVTPAGQVCVAWAPYCDPYWGCTC